MRGTHACERDVTVSTFNDSVVSGLQGRLHGLAVDGSYAYALHLASYPNSLIILDIQDPTNLTVAGSLQSQNLSDAYKVVVSGGYAYVSTGSVSVVDVSDPQSPVFVGAEQTLNMRMQDLSVAGDFVYTVGWQSHTLFAFNVTVKSSPTLVGYLRDTANFDQLYGVAVSNGHAFVLSAGGATQR